MSDKKEVLRPELWTARTVEETKALYADWAETYDADVNARGYRTPARLAAALALHAPLTSHLLDFGCGTGISGNALRAQGFNTIDGTDITPEMLEKASASGIYQKTWLSDPGEFSFGRGAYPVIVAAGVVSFGAAPPETLASLVGKLDTGGLLAFSYNDPTLADQSYISAIDDEVAQGRAEVIFREHGPHLEDIGMDSDVIILRAR